MLLGINDKQVSNGPDCYVKGEGVVHKENGPALKKYWTCTEKLYFLCK